MSIDTIIGAVRRKKRRSMARLRALLVFGSRGRHTLVYENVVIDYPENVCVGRGVRFERGVTVRVGKQGWVELGDYVRLGEMSHFRCFKGQLSIGAKSTINPGCVLYANGGIAIGERVLLAPGVKIFGANHEFGDESTPIKEQGMSAVGVEICSDVWLASDVKVLDGVVIGSHSVVGAASVVNKSLPRGSIAVGVPARPIVRDRKR